MKNKIGLLVLVLVMALGSATQAAVYNWTGAAADGSWNTPGNWSVSGSAYTWPNEQWGNEYTNEDCDEINLTTGDVVSRGSWLSIDGARDGSNTARLTLNNTSTLNVGASMWVADWGGTKGRIDVLGHSVLSVDGDLKIGDDDLSIGTLNVIDGTVSTAGNLIIANRAGSTGYLNISGNAVINCGYKFYMNDGGGAGAFSKVVMDSGTFTTGDNAYLNDDAGPSTAYFIMNGGSFNSGGVIDVSWNLDGTSHLTINGGEMIAADAIRLGVSGGADTGESRIFLNDGKLQGEDLQFNMTDSLIVYTGGELWINNSAVSEMDMLMLIRDGKIDVSGAPGYSIITSGNYTVLVPEPATIALLALGSLSLMRRKRR